MPRSSSSLQLAQRRKEQEADADRLHGRIYGTAHAVQLKIAAPQPDGRPRQRLNDSQQRRRDGAAPHPDCQSWLVLPLRANRLANESHAHERATAMG